MEDFEKVRTALKVDRWLIMGGSWGSTLALLYAERHPERVHGLILRGIYLARPHISHHMFLGPNEIFDHIDVIRRASIPTLIVHGRDDHI